jgi:hypothetical protein
VISPQVTKDDRNSGWIIRISNRGFLVSRAIFYHQLVMAVSQFLSTTTQNNSKHDSPSALSRRQSISLNFF